MCYCRSWILHANHPNPFCKVSCMPSHFESNYIGLAFGFRSVTGFGCMRGGCPVKAPVWNKAWRVWVAHCVSCPVIVQRWPFVIYIYLSISIYIISISHLHISLSISFHLYQWNLSSIQCKGSSSTWLPLHTSNLRLTRATQRTTIFVLHTTASSSDWTGFQA